MDSRTLPILRDICNIPSWVDAEHNEIAYAMHVEQFIKDHCPGLNEIIHIPISADSPRYSLLAKTPGPVRLLIATHLDTVAPTTTSKTSNSFLEGDFIRGECYFHLGASDTKGGGAALLVALKNCPNPQGLAVLFYADEEYNFAGILALIDDAKSQEWKPERAIFLEPNPMTEYPSYMIENQHRGLVELKIRIGGSTGHAADDNAGLSTAKLIIKALQSLHQQVIHDDAISQSKDSSLPPTAINIAYLVSGLFDPVFMQKETDEDIFSSIKPLGVKIQPNRKPDIAQVVLDIRPGDPEKNATYFLNILRQAVESEGGCWTYENIRHNYGALRTDPQCFADLALIIQKLGFETSWATMCGYGDGQLLAKAWNIPVVYFGPKGTNNHQAEENVYIPSLDQVALILEKLIS